MFCGGKMVFWPARFPDGILALRHCFFGRHFFRINWHFGVEFFCGKNIYFRPMAFTSLRALSEQKYISKGKLSVVMQQTISSIYPAQCHDVAAQQTISSMAGLVWQHRAAHSDPLRAVTVWRCNNQSQVWQVLCGSRLHTATSPRAVTVRRRKNLSQV